MDGRLQILLAILTVIGSGVSSGIVVYLLNARKEHVFFMINNVEETCSAATEYIHAVEEEAIFFESVFTNQDIKVKPEDLKLIHGIRSCGFISEFIFQNSSRNWRPWMSWLLKFAPFIRISLSGLARNYERFTG